MDLWSLAGGYDHPIDKAMWLCQWDIYDAAHEDMVGQAARSLRVASDVSGIEATDHVRP